MLFAVYPSSKKYRDGTRIARIVLCTRLRMSAFILIKAYYYYYYTYCRYLWAWQDGGVFCFYHRTFARFICF